MLVKDLDKPAESNSRGDDIAGTPDSEIPAMMNESMLERKRIETATRQIMP